MQLSAMKNGNTKTISFHQIVEVLRRDRFQPFKMEITIDHPEEFVALLSILTNNNPVHFHPCR